MKPPHNYVSEAKNKTERIKQLHRAIKQNLEEQKQLTKLCQKALLAAKKELVILQNSRVQVDPSVTNLIDIVLEKIENQ